MGAPRSRRSLRVAARSCRRLGGGGARSRYPAHHRRAVGARRLWDSQLKVLCSTVAFATVAIAAVAAQHKGRLAAVHELRRPRPQRARPISRRAVGRRRHVRDADRY
eukprot:5986690-Prymnesium_polylepis.1